MIKNMNRWIIVFSIISVALIITSTMGVAFEADSISSDSVKEEEILDQRIILEPVVSEDAGKIILEDSAEEVIELTGESIIIENTEILDIGIYNEEEPNDLFDEIIDETVKLEEEPDFLPTGLEETGGVPNDESEILNFENEDELLEPPEGMDLWLVFNSDTIPDDVEEGSDEISSENDLNIIGQDGADFSGDLSGTQMIDVDEVFYSECDRIIDRESYIGSILEYNIVGYVTIDVYSGENNLNGDPYFTRIDAADEALLTIASLIVMATARVASKINDLINNIDTSVIIAIAIAGGMLTALAAAVTTGTLIFSFAMVLDILTDFPILNGLLQVVANLIDELIVKPISKIFEELMPVLKQLWIDDGVAVTLLLGLADFFIPSFFTDRSVPYAIIMYLRGDTIEAIRTYLMSCGLSEAQANLKIAMLNNLKAEFNNLRANTIGKFALFMSGGNSIVSLCDLHIELADNCQSGTNQYAVILEAKAHSGKVDFDTKKIGIIYDNSDCQTLEVVQQSTTISGTQISSTQSSSSSTETTILGSTTTGTTISETTTTGTTGL